MRDADGPVAPDALVAGRRYALDVTLEVHTPTRHVAVDLPLPGGLEAIDPALGAGARARTLWTYPPFEVAHQELHPDRVLLFFDRLRPGVVHHSVIVLATAPGRYVLPPAAAEAMYTPELYARTRGASVTIAPRP
ncbi:MAG: hypothetical protein KC486_06010 [Myxococcales bacterium]|nr:hypothetical protein [Myxococcales bacterium]